MHILLNLKSLRKTEKMNLTGLVYVWAKNYTKLKRCDDLVSKQTFCSSSVILYICKFKWKNLMIMKIMKLMLWQWNDSAFSSDSEMSLEVLCFSPILPLPDVPEQKDEFLKSSWKLVDSNICLLSFRRGQTKWTFNESCIKSKGEFLYVLYFLF